MSDSPKDLSIPENQKPKKPALNFSIIDREIKASLIPKTTVHKGIDVQSFLDYTGSDLNLLTDDAEQLRANAQSGWKQFGGFLNQAILGEIAGGSIEGLGYLLDFPAMKNIAQGTEQEWGNWFSNIGIALKDWTREATPIYQESPGEFSPFDGSGFLGLDSGWWFSNGVSVASTLSLLIPTGFALKGITTATKGLASLTKATSIGSKILKSGNNVLKAAKAESLISETIAKGITQAALSRYSESMMEASAGFRDQYQSLIDKGVPEEMARKRASETASSIFKLDSVMLLQDMLQYTFMHGIKSKFKPSKAGKIVSEQSSRLPIGRFTGLVGDFISEGGEEAYQYVVTEESKYLSDVSAGVRDPSKFSDRLKAYTKEGEFLNSAFFGGFGSLLMQTVGPAIMKKLEGRTGGYNNDLISAVINEQAQYSHMNNAINVARDEGLNDQAEYLEDFSIINHTINNMNRDNESIHMETMRSFEEMNDKEIEDYVSRMEEMDIAVDPESIKQKSTHWRELAEQTANIYKKLRNTYGKEIAGTATQNYMDAIINSKKVELKEQQLSEYKNSIPKFNTLSSIGQSRVTLEMEEAGLERAKETISKLVDVFEDDETISSKYKTIFKNINKNLINLKNKKKKEEVKEYDSEQAERDIQIRKGIDPYIDEASKIISDREIANQISISSNEEYGKNISLAKDKSKSEEKKNQAKIINDFKNNTSPSKEDSVIEKDDFVEHNGFPGQYKGSYQNREGETKHKIKDLRYPNQNKFFIVDDEDFKSSTKKIKTRKQEADEQEEEKNIETSRKEQASVRKTKSSIKKRSPKNKGKGNAEFEDMFPPISEYEDPTPSEPSFEESEPDLEERGDLSGVPHFRSIEEMMSAEDVSNSQDNAISTPGGIENMIVPENEIQDSFTPSKVNTSKAIEIVDGLQVTTSSVNNPSEPVYKKDKNSKDYLEAKRWSDFIENQQPIKDEQGYKFYVTAEIDFDYLNKTNPELSKQVESFDQNIDVDLLPIRLSVRNYGETIDFGKDSLVYIDGEPVYTYLKDPRTLENKNNPLLEKAILQLREERKYIYSALLDGKTPYAPIIKKSAGFFRVDEDVVWGDFSTYNTALSVLEGQPNIRYTEDIELSISDGVAFTNSNGQPRLNIDSSGGTKGAVYATVVSNNGSTRPMRLLADSFTPSEAELVYQIYKEMIVNGISPKDPIPERIQAFIRESTDPRVLAIDQIDDSIISLKQSTISDVLNFLVFEGKNKTKNKGESTLYRDEKNLNLYFGNNKIYRSDLDNDIKKQQFIKWIRKNRRHQVVRSHIDNPSYKMYLMDSYDRDMNIGPILATNAYPFGDGKVNIGPMVFVGNFSHEINTNEYEHIDDSNITPSSSDIDEEDSSQIDSTSIFQRPKFSNLESLPKVMSERGMIRLFDRLKEQFNIPYKVINDPYIKWAGKNDNGIIFINTAHATIDTPFHEFAHPFVEMIKRNNIRLYMNLIDELRNSTQGKRIILKVQRLYADHTPEQRIDESIVQMLGELSSGRIHAKESKLKRALRQFWIHIQRMIRKLLGKDITIDLSSLSPTTTLGELSTILSDNLTHIDLSEVLLTREQRPEWMSYQEYTDWIDSMSFMFIKSNMAMDISDIKGAKLTTVRDIIRNDLKKFPPNSPMIDRYNKVLDNITTKDGNLNPESELLIGIQKRLKTYGIVPIQEVNEEDSSSRLNIKESYEFSSKDKASVHVKLMVSNIPQLHSNNRVINKFSPLYREDRVNKTLNDFNKSEKIQLIQEALSKGIFKKQTENIFSKEHLSELSTLFKPDYILSEWTGYPKYHSFSNMWNIIQTELSDIVEMNTDDGIEDIFELDIQKLKEASILRPELTYLIEMLQKSSEWKQTEFVQVLNLANQNFSSTFFNTKKENIYYRFASSDSQSISRKIVDEWDSNFRSKLGTTLKNPETGEVAVAIRSDIAENLVNRYKALVKKTDEASRNDIKIPDALKIEFRELLNDTGISISDRTVEKLILDSKIGKNSIDKFRQILTGSKGTSIRYIYTGGSLSLENAIGERKNRFKLPTDEDGVTIITDEQFIDTIAETEAYFQNQLFENTIIGPENKSFWKFSQYNSMLKKIAEWKRGTQSLEEILKAPYNTHSQWGKWLMKSQENRNSFNLINFIEFKKLFSSDKGVKNNKLGITDLLSNNLNRTINGIFPLPSRADKTTEYMISGPQVIRSFRKTEHNTIELRDSAVRIIKEYLLDEVLRIKQVEAQIQVLPEEKWAIDYHYKLDVDSEGNEFKNPALGNAFKIHIMPNFNPLTLQEKQNLENGDIVREDNSRFIFNSDGKTITLTKENWYDNKALTDVIKKSFNKQFNKDLKKLTTHRVIRKSGNSYINNSIDSKKLKEYYVKEVGNSISLGIQAAIMDYTFNGIVANQEWHKLFGGDIAVFKTYSDFQKRASAPGSTGLMYRIMKDMSPTYSSAVVNDIIVPSDLLKDENIKAISKYTGFSQEEVKNLLKAYSKVNVSDAQAWITPELYRDRMRGYGKWSDDHQKAYERLMNNKLSYKDLKLFMSPLKTTHTEMRIQDGNNIFHLNKQSEALLHPAIANALNLGELLKAMREQKTEHVIVKSGKKTGGSGITTIVDENGKILNSKDIILNPVSLSKRFIFLQQESTTKGMKSFKEGSQTPKNILDGIIDDGIYIVNGKEINGIEFRKEIHRTIGALSDKGLQEIKDIVGWNEEYQTYDEKKLRNYILESFSKIENDNLTKALIEDVEINGKTQRRPFDAIPQIRIGIETKLASLIKKKAVELEHNTGGNYIQMSGLGWTTGLDTETSSIIKYIDKDAKSGLKPPRIDPETGEFKPGQIFIPHKLALQLNLSEDNLSELMKDIKTGISYRTPNQSIASNDVVEIAGILPPEMGDTVVLYKEVTTKFGSDFDIDKLGIMLPNYKIVDGKIKVHKFFTEDEIDTNNEEDLKKIYIDRFGDVVPEVSRIIADAKLRETELWGDLITGFKLDETVVEKVKEILIKDTTLSIDKIEEYIDNMFTMSIHDLLSVPSLEDFINENKGKDIYYVNSKLAIQNRKLELYKSMLSNPKTFINTITPLDGSALSNIVKLRAMLYDGRITREQFDNSRNDKNKIKDLIDTYYEVKYDDFELFSPTTQVEIRKTFIDTKSAVGQIQNHVTDHAFSQNIGLYLNEKGSLGETPYYLGIGNSIEINGEKATLLSSINDVNGDRISRTLDLFLTAMVDAPTDPYIASGNFTLFTNDVAMLLVRSGVPKENIVNFIGADSIRKLSSITSEYNSKTSKRYKIEEVSNRELNEVEYVTYNITRKMIDGNGNSMKTIDLNSVTDIDTINPEQVIDRLGKNPTPQDQLDALRLFVEWKDYSNALEESIRASKADVDGLGSSITSARVKQSLKSKVENDGIIGNFSEKFNDTFLGNYYRNSIEAGLLMFGKNTFIGQTKEVQNVINSIAMKTGLYPIISEDIAFTLSAEIYAYIMQGTDFGLSRESLKNMLIGKDSLGRKLLVYKHNPTSPIKENPLIQYLGVKLGKQSDQPDFIYAQGTKKLSKEAIDIIIDGWKDLLEHDNPNVREIGEQLGKYAYYSSGFKRNLSSFHELIPISLSDRFKVSEKIKELQIKLEEDGNVMSVAVDQIIKNLQDDSRIVPNVFSYFKEIHSFPGLSKNNGFYIYPEEYSWLKIGEDQSGNPVMKPYINMDDALFEYRGIGIKPQKKGNKVLKNTRIAVYTPVSSLGIKQGRFRIKEYNVNLSTKTLEEPNGFESVFTENNVVEHKNLNKILAYYKVDKNEISNIKDVYEPSDNTDALDNTTEIKEGVPELFESNPELANAVYEALGFENAIIQIPDKYELDKEYNLKSVLNNLLNTESESINNIYKILLNSIPSNLKLIYSKNIRQNANGEFIYLEDIIKINPDKFSHKTLIHEIIHALTHDKLLKNEEFNNKITVLRKRAVKYFEENRPRAIQGNTKSALASNDEFLSGLFNYKNLDFLNTLNNIPIENTTLLEKIKNVFKDLINEVFNIAGIRLSKNSLLFEVINELGQIEISQITPQQKQEAQQLYSQYLDTIFPNSEVKDIVYHGGKTNKEDFKRFVDKTKYEDRNTNSILGFFFSSSKNIVSVQYAEKDYDAIEDQLTGDAETDAFIRKSSPLKKGSISEELLNIKNPYIIQAEEWENETWVDKLNILTEKDKNDKWTFDYKWTVDAYEKVKNHLQSLGYDGLYINSNQELYKKTGIVDYITVQKVVFEPEQIHILGSKQDVEGFKGFVDNRDVITTQPQSVEDFVRNEIKDKIIDISDEELQKRVEEYSLNKDKITPESFIESVIKDIVQCRKK